jgi:hypothetical protein
MHLLPNSLCEPQEYETELVVKRGKKDFWNGPCCTDRRYLLTTSHQIIDGMSNKDITDLINTALLEPMQTYTPLD